MKASTTRRPPSKVASNSCLFPVRGEDPEIIAEIGDMAPFHHLSLSVGESDIGDRFFFAKTDHLEADSMISRLAD